MLTAGMLLEHLGHPDLKDRIEAAVAHCLHTGQVTRELGGTLSTRDVGDAVLAWLASH
jgi:3-isopropylmalate dehydrogenase